MSVENFKSYAGARIIGPFHKSFSAVVGPNGSGKSNVIDALLFVFGKRGKKIRADKIGGLVHSSDAYPDLDRCSVTVHFAQVVDAEVDADPTGPADTDGVEMPGSRVLVGSRFTVSRSATKKNVSTYAVNGRATTMATVTSLLKARGIDLDHNRFLILQGEVESISLMKPKGLAPGEEGLLEYLEDIIGSNQHLPRIGELQADLEAANNERATAMARARAVERELASLAGAKREAEAYLEKKRHALEARGEQGASLRARASVAHREQTVKAEAAQAELAEEAKKNEAKRAELEQAEAAAEEARVKYNAAAEVTAGHKATYTELERRDVALQQRIKQATATMEKLEKAVAADEKETKAKETAVSTARAAVAESAEQETALAADLEKAQAELDAARAEATGELAAAIAEKRAALEPLQVEATDAKNAAAAAEQEAALLGQRLTTARSALEAAEAQLVTLREESATLASRTAEAESVIAESADRLAEAQAAVEATAGALVAAKATAGEARSRANAAAERANSSKTESKVLGALLKAKRKGLLPGVIGRLGDLGAVPRAYAVAASCAAPSLNNIVVDTADTAQRCIKLLRKYDLGVATFIALDKISQRVPASQPPAGSRRLFDLVTDMVDRAIAPAFYHAFGETLLVQDLATGRKVAFSPGPGKRRWRVVTLAGELIEATGAMSGGGAGARMSGAALKIRVASADGASSASSMDVGADDDEDPAELAAKATAAEAAARESQARADEASATLAALEQEVEAARETMDKVTADRASLPDTIAAVESSLPELREALKAARANKAEEKFAAATEAAQTLAATAAELHEKVTAATADLAALERDALEAGGTRVAVQQERVNSLTSQISLVQTRAKASRADETKATRQLEKLATRLTASAKKIEEAKATQAELDVEFKQLAEDASIVKATYKEALVAEEAEAEIVGGLQEAAERLKAELASAGSREFDLRRVVDTIAASLKTLEHKVQQWSTRLDEHQEEYRRFAEEIDAANGLEPEEEEEEEEAEGDGERRASSASDAEVGSKRAADEAVTSPAKKAKTVDGEAVPARATAVLPALRMSEEHLVELDTAAAEARAVLLETQLVSMAPNMAALAKWRAKEVERRERVAVLEEATKARDTVRAECDEARKARLDQFMEGFTIISTRLKEMYQLITLGGDAELELVDSLDPFSEGIVFSVRPPKKSWKQIGNLSGGEKTLSSLALVFALHTYKPTPLYVMDEIDAALDFKNVSIVANYVKERTKDAQFVIISLRSYMFELADRLVGIYKTNDCTKSVTVNPSSFAIEDAPAAPPAPTPTSAPTRTSAKAAAAAARVDTENNAVVTQEA
jgi:structural maintenance of chromosome 4